MNEMIIKPFKKLIVAALCIVAVCGVLAFMSFSQSGSCDGTPRTFAVYILSELPTSTHTPIPIQESAQEQAEYDPNPYADLEVTDAEKQLLACMAFNEARGESFEGQVAVIQVALNRFMHEAYSGSISDILLAPCQFSVGNYYEETQMKAVEAALAGEQVLDLNTDVVYFSTGGLTYGSYYKAIGAHVFRTYT